MPAILGPSPAPVLTDLSAWLADVAGKAGIAWERLFDAPEEKSLRTLRYEIDLTSQTIETLEGRIRELQESPTLGFTTLIDTAQISALESKLEDLRRARDQTRRSVHHRRRHLRRPGRARTARSGSPRLDAGCADGMSA